VWWCVEPASGAGLTIEITIAHGQVTPANATLQATVRQPITLHVTSDATDEFARAFGARSQVRGGRNGQSDIPIQRWTFRAVSTSSYTISTAPSPPSTCIRDRAGHRRARPWRVERSSCAVRVSVIGAAWALTFTFAVVALA